MDTGKLYYSIYDHTGEITQRILVVDVSDVPPPDIYNEAELLINLKWGRDFDIKISHGTDGGTIGIYKLGELKS